MESRPRARALGALAAHLPPELTVDALTASVVIGDEWNRGRALGSLAPHLSPRLMADALAAARAIRNEEDRVHALAALAAAKAIGNDEARAGALDLLAGHVVPSQHAALLTAIIRTSTKRPLCLDRHGFDTKSHRQPARPQGLSAGRVELAADLRAGGLAKISVAEFSFTMSLHQQVVALESHP